MSIILSKNLTVKNGQLICVYNSLKPSFSNEAKSYYALWIKDPINKNENCLLFTKAELHLMKDTYNNNSENYKLGYIYSEVIGKRSIFLVKYLDLNKAEHFVTMSTKLLYKALERAKKNIEDNPEKSWFVDKISEEWF
jgi:hypothetical protein